MRATRARSRACSTTSPPSRGRRCSCCPASSARPSGSAASCDNLADPRCLQLSATVGDELAGNLGLRPDAHPNSAHVTWLGMSVAEPFRGLGLGGALLETAAEWAAVSGFVKLALGVFPENARAVAFYARHGFTEEGRRRAQYVRAGRYHDEVLMARFLTTPV